MFTGLVESVGSMVSLTPHQGGARLRLDAGSLAAKMTPGDSLSVNGCCLTVALIHGNALEFDCLAETLEKTNLGNTASGGRVNLERSLAADGRLGGHFVQGHVDATGRVTSADLIGQDLRLQVEFPAEFAVYTAYKGSVAINGTSLTVAEAGEDFLVVWIIPHTRTATNLGDLKAGAQVNLEFDILAKYVRRQLGRE